jgi:hypothetical protein
MRWKIWGKKMSELSDFTQVVRPLTISTTQLVPGRKCKLQFIFNSTFKNKEALPASSAHKYLGIVTHDFIEYARGRSPGEQLDEGRWDSLLEEMAEKINENDCCWLGNSEVPFEQTFDDLERYRLRAILAAENETTGHQQRLGGTGSGGGEDTRETGSEIPLIEDKLVKGKADAVDEVEGQLIIRDFKSGNVCINNDIKEEYKSQLKIYAYLYFKRFGRFPDCLELIDKRGLSFRIDFTKEESEQSYNEAVSFLRALQEEMAADTINIQSLADHDFSNIQGEVCDRCQHRPLCPEHKSHLFSLGKVNNESNAYVSSIDLAGRIVNKGNNYIRICHEQTQKIYLIRGINENDFDENILVSIYSVRPTYPHDDENALVFHALPNTKVFEISEENYQDQFVENISINTHCALNGSESIESENEIYDKLEVVGRKVNDEVQDFFRYEITSESRSLVKQEDFQTGSQNLAAFVGLVEAVKMFDFQDHDEVKQVICSNKSAFSWICLLTDPGNTKGVHKYRSRALGNDHRRCIDSIDFMRLLFSDYKIAKNDVSLIFKDQLSDAVLVKILHTRSFE